MFTPFCILSKYLLRYVRTFVPYSILLTPCSSLPPLPCFTFLPFSIRYLAKPGKGGEGRGIRPPHSMRKGSENQTEFGQSSMKGGRTQELIHMAHIYTHKINKETPLAHLKGGRSIHRLTGELSSCYLIPARLSFSWTEVASLPPPSLFALPLLARILIHRHQEERSPFPPYPHPPGGLYRRRPGRGEEEAAVTDNGHFHACQFQAMREREREKELLPARGPPFPPRRQGGKGRIPDPKEGGGLISPFPPHKKEAGAHTQAHNTLKNGRRTKEGRGSLLASIRPRVPSPPFLLSAVKREKEIGRSVGRSVPPPPPPPPPPPRYAPSSPLPLFSATKFLPSPIS